MAEAEPTHYDVLEVSRSATRVEIERCYLDKKRGGQLSGPELWALERAYSTLCDPNQKRRYDSDLDSGALALKQPPPKPGEAPPTASSGRAPAARKWNLNQPRLLAAALVAFALAFAFVLWPYLGWRLQSFAVGTDLITATDQKPYGQVLEYRSDHAFPGGITAPAYRLRLPSGAEAWVTKEEANQIALPRR